MTTRIAILDDYQHAALRYAEWSKLPKEAELDIFDDHIAERDEAALVRRLAPFDIVCVMRERTPLRASLLAQLPKLKLIVTTGVSNASIDMDAAKARGILVCGCRGMSDSTAELSLTLMLALSRNLVAEHNAVLAGKWQLGVGRTLENSTVGLVGLGHLGGIVARLARAFNANVIAWSQNLTAAQAAEHGVERVEKDELFRRSDFVSIHLRQSPRTIGLVGTAEFALMKPTAYLVNTSRGPIVDETALVEALAEGRIAGAGLDVFDEEPLPRNHPLLRSGRVILTPHVGYVVEAMYSDFFADMLDNVLGYLSGKPVNVIDGPPTSSGGARRG